MTAPAMLRRPLLGGVFGSGRFELATQPTISRGLHAVRFFVIEPAAGRVLSISESKLEAIAGARRLLREHTAGAEHDPWVQGRLWDESELAAVSTVAPKARPVSRRRRKVFERSAGRCHYCNCRLELAGVWHIEHQMPQALGGTDSPGNLVAACAPCNLAKRDRTAIEFVAA